jgi:hypothetical protein
MRTFAPQIGGAYERLHDGPVSQHIGRRVDFVLGAINQINLEMFKVLVRRIVNDRRGIGAYIGQILDTRPSYFITVLSSLYYPCDRIIEMRLAKAYDLIEITKDRSRIGLV